MGFFLKQQMRIAKRGGNEATINPRCPFACE